MTLGCDKLTKIKFIQDRKVLQRWSRCKRSSSTANWCRVDFKITSAHPRTAFRDDFQSYETQRKMWVTEIKATFLFNPFVSLLLSVFVWFVPGSLFLLLKTHKHRCWPCLPFPVSSKNFPTRSTHTFFLSLENKHENLKRQENTKFFLKRKSIKHKQTHTVRDNTLAHTEINECSFF